MSEELSVIDKIEKKLLERKPFLIKNVAKTLYDAMSFMCRECQSDRIRCAFEPMCDSRIYLSILIESEADISELPELCFKFRLAEISKFYMRKPIPGSLDDAKMYLREFFKIYNISVKENIEDTIKKFVEKVKKYWSDIQYKHIKNRWYIFFNRGDIITVIDEKRRLVNINIREDFESVDEYIEITKILAELNNLKMDILKPYPLSVYAKFYLDIDFKNIKSKFKEFKSIGGLKIVNESTKTILYFEILSPDRRLDISNFKQIIKSISKIKSGG